MELVKNRDANNAAPVYIAPPGGTNPAARDWIRNEYIYDGKWLEGQFVDRRALADDASGDLSDSETARMLEYTYVHLPDGTPYEVGLPSGATRTLTIDGYGTIYKSEITNGTDTLLEFMQYVDGELDPEWIFRGTPGGNELWTHYERDADTGNVIGITEPTEATTYRLQAYTAIPGAALGGATHELDYDSRSLVTKIATFGASGELARTDYVLDQLGRARQIIDHALGAGPGGTRVTTRVYDGRWLVEEDLPGARSSTWSYDTLGRLEQATDAEQQTTTFTYHAGTDWLADRQFATIEDRFDGTHPARAYQTKYLWDGLGRLTQLEQHGTNHDSTAAEIHQFGYFTTGGTQWHKHFKDNGSGVIREERYLPDALGRIRERVLMGDPTTPDKIVNSAAYFDWTATAARTRTERVDGVGHKTVVHYDYAGRPDILERPGAPNYSTDKTTAREHTDVLFYDAASRVQLAVDGSAGVTRFHYDGVGRLVMRDLDSAGSEMSSLVTKEVLVRDARGRILYTGSYTGDPNTNSLATMLENSTEVRSEDSLGRVHSESYVYFGSTGGAASVSTTFDSSTFDYPATLSYTANMSLTFALDKVGRLTSMDWGLDGGTPSNLATWKHLGALQTGRRVAWTSSVSGATDRQYDVYGRLTQITDTLDDGSSPVGLTDFQFQYDDWGYLTHEQYVRQDGGQGDRFRYDEFGRLEKAWLGVANIAVTDPDTGSFLRSITYGESASPVGAGLDAAGNRSKVFTQYDDAQGAIETEEYTVETTGVTGSNRYDAFKPDGASGFVQLDYDNRGNLIYDGTLYYVYDYRNRLTEVYLVVEDGSTQTTLLGGGAGTSGPTSTAGATEVRTRDDMLRRLGNPLTVRLHDLSALETARHTILGRFQDGIRGLTNSARLRQRLRDGVYVEPIRLDTGAGDAVIAAGGSLSGGGSLTSSSSISTTSLPEGAQLVPLAYYLYDAFGRRLVRQVIAEQRTYLSSYDGWRETEEFEVLAGGGNRAIHQFVWGERLDELIGYRYREPGGSVGDPWQRFFVTQLGQKSITRVMTVTGAVGNEQVAECLRLEYDPYGRPNIYSNTGQYVGELAGAQIGLLHYWKGHRRDPETGFVYMRHRYYDVRQGRFVSSDPIGGWADSRNRGNGYAYAANAPQVLRDPYGLQGKTELSVSVYNNNVANVGWVDRMWEGFPTKVNSFDDLIGHLDNEINGGGGPQKPVSRIWP